jgi:hypothetical protein
MYRNNTLNELDTRATALMNQVGNTGRNIAMAQNADIENEELTYEGETRVLRKKNDTSRKDLEVIAPDSRSNAFISIPFVTSPCHALPRLAAPRQA